jgi:hypothetical protein
MDQYITTSMYIYTVNKKIMDDRLKFTGSIRYDKAWKTFRLGCLLYILVVKVGDITLEDHFKPVLETLLHKTSTSDLM